MTAITVAITLLALAGVAAHLHMRWHAWASEAVMWSALAIETTDPEQCRRYWLVSYQCAERIPRIVRGRYLSRAQRARLKGSQ